MARSVEAGTSCRIAERVLGSPSTEGFAMEHAMPPRSVEATNVSPPVSSRVLPIEDQRAESR